MFSSGAYILGIFQSVAVLIPEYSTCYYRDHIQSHRSSLQLCKVVDLVFLVHIGVPVNQAPPNRPTPQDINQIPLFSEGFLDMGRVIHVMHPLAEPRKIPYCTSVVSSIIFSSQEEFLCICHFFFLLLPFLSLLFFSRLTFSPKPFSCSM